MKTLTTIVATWLIGCAVDGGGTSVDDDLGVPDAAAFVVGGFASDAAPRDGDDGGIPLGDIDAPEGTVLLPDGLVNERCCSGLRVVEPVDGGGICLAPGDHEVRVRIGFDRHCAGVGRLPFIIRIIGGDLRDSRIDSPEAGVPMETGPDGVVDIALHIGDDETAFVLLFDVGRYSGTDSVTLPVGSRGTWPCSGAWPGQWQCIDGVRM